jgi:hypothetical protein
MKIVGCVWIIGEQGDNELCCFQFYPRPNDPTTATSEKKKNADCAWIREYYLENRPNAGFI